MVWPVCCSLALKMKILKSAERKGCAMYSFLNDYSETAHPRIIEALAATNMEQLAGYGMDKHSLAAVAHLKEKLNAPNADIHFLAGGTQTNLMAAAAFLSPIEGVVCAQTGHINALEAGSVEATGHKILVENTQDGKLTTAHLNHAVKAYVDEHSPVPRMVYISNTTETGTVYTKAELEALYAFCKQNGMILFIDGARLASALAYAPANLTLADLKNLCDAFYIGATKNGAMFGEAMVIINDTLKPYFRYHMKQRGAILAKGKVMGIQFEELFKDDLYLELGRHANAMADKLRNGIKALGYSFIGESPSNQMFPIFPASVLAKLAEEFVCGDATEMPGGEASVRLVTSWATKEEEVDRFLSLLKTL